MVVPVPAIFPPMAALARDPGATCYRSVSEASRYVQTLNGVKEVLELLSGEELHNCFTCLH